MGLSLLSATWAAAWATALFLDIVASSGHGCKYVAIKKGTQFYVKHEHVNMFLAIFFNLLPFNEFGSV